MDRVDHSFSGDRAGVDFKRVKFALERRDRVYCEADSGDAVFFLGNVLHRSEENRSDKAR